MPPKSILKPAAAAQAPVAPGYERVGKYEMELLCSLIYRVLTSIVRSPPAQCARCQLDNVRILLNGAGRPACALCDRPVKMVDRKIGGSSPPPTGAGDEGWGTPEPPSPEVVQARTADWQQESAVARSNAWPIPRSDFAWANKQMERAGRFNNGSNNGSPQSEWTYQADLPAVSSLAHDHAERPSQGWEGGEQPPPYKRPSLPEGPHGPPARHPIDAPAGSDHGRTRVLLRRMAPLQRGFDPARRSESRRLS